MSSAVSAHSRNAPCHCGSGKRYKDCHGALRSTAAGWVERGLAQMKARDFNAAEASLREAQHLAPNDARVHANLATLYVHWRRYAEAEESLATALSLAPDEPYVLALLAHTRQSQCAWHDLSSLYARIAEALERGGEAASACDPFPLLSMPLTAAQQLLAAQRYARDLAPPKPISPPAFAVAPEGRMRIGFVSSDFRRHATATLMTEFWERIDRSRLELFAYGIFARDTGRVGQRIERALEHFADVSAEPVDRIARRIRGDRIDVLFDLNGYTRSAQPQIFALRPAPVQVNAIGFQGTLGAKWYDYILTDNFSMPERLARFFTEEPLFMPHVYPSDTTRLAPGPPPSRTACGLPEQAFVFCCFNNAYKILPEVFAIWMRLLAAVAGSVLWLLETEPAAKKNLQREAGLAAIDPSRLVFAPRVDLEEHVARNAAADLFLDTYPYCAHTTANDALLAGLPLLTRVGETLASRIAGSQLHAVGLPELVTESFADYEALALRLATQAGPLGSYRRRLAAQRRSSPLFDMDRYARDFADAVQRIEARHRTP